MKHKWVARHGLKLVVGLVSLLALLALACAGPAGDKGPAGEKGPAGAQGVAGVAGPAGPTGPAGAAGIKGDTGPAGAQGAPAAAVAGPGLNATITKVDIAADGKVTVSYKLDDGKGNPVSRTVLDAGRERFSMAFISVDAATTYTSWVGVVTGDRAGAAFQLGGKTVQPAIVTAKGVPLNAADTTGVYKEVTAGSYTYTLATVLPANYDKNATTRVMYQASRADRTVVTNATFDFVPAGGTVKVTREVVAIASCNKCHDPLAIHSGARRDTKLCVVCHTSQNVDPNSGNNLNLMVMAHKIHRGNSLPSVRAGNPYFVGSGSHDYTDVGFPQDVRNCTTCHDSKVALNADNYKTNPSRAACGACHDQIDWATGKSIYTGGNDHLGGPATDDKNCKLCHQPDSGSEFDASVVGAHVIPLNSKQLKGYSVEIVRVTSTAPGQFPTVVFTAKDKAGAVVPAAGIGTLTFNVNGPTTDYKGPPVTESATLANIKVGTDGTYSYTLTRPIPTDATGTYAIGIESRRTEKITGNGGVSTDVSVYTYNPIAYVPVTDKVAVPRRQVVSTENCNVCHKEIAFHGGGRKNTAGYCELCHNPANVDVPALAPGGPFAVPAESINMSLMVHRIHTGEELTSDYTIYRSRGVFNFNEVRFPGDLRNCSKCHVGTSFTLPLPATNANTLAPREFYSPLGPAASACLGCHDSRKAAAHGSTMTSSIGEACAVCHGRGKDADVAKVHAQ